MTTTLETPQGHCRLGMAHEDITPPVGIYHRMWGAARHDQAEGVHRPLRATVLVTESLAGDQRQLLLSLDHCIMRQSELEPLLVATAKAAEVPESSVVVTFSHTHAAGLMSADRVGMPGGDLILPYLESVRDASAAAAARAVDQICEARLVYGEGSCNLARERDFWDANSDQFVCGFNPQGESDQTITVVQCEDMKQQCLGTVVNYGCHPTTLAWDNRLISPDYPGAMREVIERETAAPCLFLQGMSGDLGPRDGFTGDPQVADRNGRQLGYASLSAILGLPPAGTCQQYQGPVTSGATIGCWEHVQISGQRADEIQHWEQRSWQFPLPYRSELERMDQVQTRLQERLAEEAACRDAGQTDEAQQHRALAERDQRLLSRLSELPGENSFPYQVTCWRMGDAVWLFLPGEPYQQLQLQLRSHFAPRPLVIVSNSGPWGPSYLVPADKYGKGIYQETVAVLAAGCLEQLVESLVRELEDWLD